VSVVGRSATSRRWPIISSSAPARGTVAAPERELIRRALEASSANRTEAARRLQINRRLRYSKMRDHGLE
jgi:DNA-binding NtrC family response regulator